MLHSYFHFWIRSQFSRFWILNQDFNVWTIGKLLKYILRSFSVISVALFATDLVEGGDESTEWTLCICRTLDTDTKIVRNVFSNEDVIDKNRSIARLKCIACCQFMHSWEYGNGKKLLRTKKKLNSYSFERVNERIEKDCFVSQMAELQLISICKTHNMTSIFFPLSYRSFYGCYFKICNDIVRLYRLFTFSALVAYGPHSIFFSPPIGWLAATRAAFFYSTFCVLSHYWMHLLT